MNTWAKQQNARQAAGQCRQCGKPRDSADRRLCAFHAAITLAQTKARCRSRRATGICKKGGCGKPLFKGGLCDSHYKAQLEYCRRYRAKRRAAQVPEKEGDS